MNKNATLVLLISVDSWKYQIQDAWRDILEKKGIMYIGCILQANNCCFENI